MPTSSPAGQLLLEFSLIKFDEITAIVASMSDTEAVRHSGLPGANTPYGILNHVLGMMRRWSSSVNRGIEIPRNREAEFTAVGSVDELLDRAGKTRQAFISDVLAVDFRQAPVQVPEGREIFWTSTTGGVLLHVFEELCQHLGQLEITRDLLGAISEGENQ